MKKTIRLIVNKIWKIDKLLFLNWLIYSLCKLVFNVLWILLPEKILTAIALNDIRQLISNAGVIGLIAAVSAFFETMLRNNAWMRMQNIRYFVLLDLLDYSIRVPYHKTLDSDFLSELEKTRIATMNPNIGIGSILTGVYEILGLVLSACGLVWILSHISWLFILFVIGTIALSFVLNRKIIKIEDKEWKKKSPIQRKYEKVYDTLMDESYAKDIRIFSLRPILHKYGSKYANAIHNISGNVMEEKKKYQILSQMIEMIRNVIVYLWIAVYVIRGNMQIGSFLTYSLGVIQFSKTVQTILQQYMAFVKESRRFSGFWNIRKIALNATETDMCEQNDLQDEEGILIEFIKVTFYYPNASKPALKNISFKIEAGKRAALVGTNGTGKSTIVKLICRLYTPQSGTIQINGVDINTIPIQKYYDLLCVIFQSGMLFPYTIQDNITLSERIDSDLYQSVTKASDFEPIEAKLYHGKDTYISHTMSDDCTELSGGEKQKLLLARALYHNGSLFLLDEPAGAMDAIAEEELYKKYWSITERKTSIIISHQLSFVAFCDNIFLLEEGSICESGTHAELMDKRGRYYEMYIAQREQYQENEKKKCKAVH